MYRLLEPEEGKVLARFQNFYPTSFHEKVSSSPLMDKFYEKAVSVSGLAEMINESKEPITIVDIAGGRGRLKDVVEKVAKKEFNYVVVDLSREQLGKSKDFHRLDKEGKGEKFRVIGDMSSVPVAGADAAVLLNSPNAVVGFYYRFFAKYGKSFEKGFSVKEFGKIRESEEFKIHVLLNAMMSSTDKLNILEATKLLKQDGVLVIGGFARAISAYPVEEMRGIPLEVRNVEKFKLNRDVMKLWSDYSGNAVENQPFFVAAFTKTGEVGEELIGECEKTFKDSFQSLIKSKRFWEILNELEKIEKEKKDAADEFQKVAKKIIKE
ncbi:hypothetical protein H0N99_04525 [Candidatus Micrarchaeota archaeon]|nr:hypothetical protein [Candidatus Micrarchaeota archaeon]